jgi:tetratricopeptide (TPR) repeat protein
MLVAVIAVAATLATDTLYARAESLLAAGALPQARRIAERLEHARPADPKVLILLGRVHLAWPVIGRFRAESLFARAAQLAPQDPEPPYWAARAGLALGGDDGESMARAHLERAVALDPDYRDAFALWLGLYRDDGARRRMVAALAGHAGRTSADLRRAALLIELRAYPLADSLLRDLVTREPDMAAPYALLAQSLFEQGRDVEGGTFYEAALARAATDTDSVLWRQARAIATPVERRAWTEHPQDPEAFFRLLWARRDPDASTPINERLGEHFRRAAQARRFFTLLHPASRWHHSARYRALSDVGGLPGGPAAQGVVVEARGNGCVATVPGVRDAPYLVGQGARAPQPAGDTTPNLEDGLDDRGRVFIRHGAPTERLVFNLDGETWCYQRPGGVLRVTFLRRTGNAWDASGDMVFTPVLTGEAESAVELTSTDRPSVSADLSFTFWPAAFRDRSDRYRTELLVFPDSLRGAAALVDPHGRVAARDTATGRALHVIAEPGPYVLLLDGTDEGHRGLYRGTIALPDYGGDTLAVSGLLMAAGTVPADRDSLAAAAPPGLVLNAVLPLRVYAEVYGLGNDSGTARYEVRYQFERANGKGERVTTIAFTREGPHGPSTIESLVIDPGRLPPGRYRLYVEVEDRVRAAHTSSASLTFTLR